MSFKDRVRKYTKLEEMAVPASKRANILNQMRDSIDKDNYEEAAKIFKRNGGVNVTKDFKKSDSVPNGLTSAEVNKLKSAIKSIGDDVESQSEKSANADSGQTEFVRELKTTLETIKDRYKSQLSVLKGNPIDMSSPAAITRKDSREGVEKSQEYRENKIKEIKDDIKILNLKIDDFKEINDQEFKDLSIDEKREYMNKKKEARELREKMENTLKKYDRGVRDRKKQRGRPDSAIDRAGKHGKEGVALLKTFEGIVNKYNTAKPITKQDIDKLKNVLIDWLPLMKDRTDTFYDPKQVGVLNRSLKKISELSDNDYDNNTLDVDKSEEIFDELSAIDID